MREHYTLGRGFMRRTLLELNRHLKYSDREPDNEFNEFVDHYEKHFYAFNRQAIDADPYEWTAELASSASGVEEREWEWPSLVGSFYKVLAAGDGGAHDQALWWYMKQARREKRHVLEGLRLRGDEIPPAHRAIIQLLFKG